MPADYDGPQDPALPACPLSPPVTDGFGPALATGRRRTYLCDVSSRYIRAIHRVGRSSGGFMRSKSGVLELAVLGLLHESPMHGYELRKRLNTLLGMFRAFSYGSLYPCLKELLGQGLIAEDDQEPAATRPGGTRRSKIVYRLTAEGKER